MSTTEAKESTLTLAPMELEFLAHFLENVDEDVVCNDVADEMLSLLQDKVEEARRPSGGALLEMLPCPFCGAKPWMGEVPGVGDTHVQCSNPNCHSRPSVLGSGVAAAVARWNRRVEVL